MKRNPFRLKTHFVPRSKRFLSQLQEDKVEALSRKHCRRGKAISTTLFYVCACARVHEYLRVFVGARGHERVLARV